MGGMAALEWPLCCPKGYVQHLIALATSARHSAWCISWGEAQRQSIYSDPLYEDGFYSAQPASGLAAARMSALLTYRSRDSFESRFGRKAQGTGGSKGAVGTLTPPASPKVNPVDHSLTVHNDGLRKSGPASPAEAVPSGNADVAVALPLRCRCSCRRCSCRRGRRGRRCKCCVWLIFGMPSTLFGHFLSLFFSFFFSSLFYFFFLFHFFSFLFFLNT